jgi:Radical SAM superfamily
LHAPVSSTRRRGRMGAGREISRPRRHLDAAARFYEAGRSRAGADAWDNGGYDSGSMRRFLSISERASDEPTLVSFIDECRSWTLNTYDKCDFRCIYCVTRSQGASAPKLPRDSVGAAVRAQISRVPADAAVQVGAIADAYPPSESENGVTRPAVEELVADGRPFNVITKGLAVRRDFDLLLASKQSTLVISLCSHEDERLERLDPRAPRSAERLELARDAREAGIPVTMSIAPWIPHITRIEAIMDRVPPGISALVAPLNVNVGIDYPILGRSYDQDELNALFLAERERLSHRSDICWYPTVNADGSIYVGR